MQNFRQRMARLRGGPSIDDNQNAGQQYLHPSTTSPPSSSSGSDDDESSSAKRKRGQSHHKAPTHADVHTVRDIFCASLHLPMELVDMILEVAEYFPSVFSRADGPSSCAATWADDNKAAKLLVISAPIPRSSNSELSARPETQSDELQQQEGEEEGGRLEAGATSVPHDELIRIRSVRFRLHSSDQGWGGEQPDTYNGAHSWFSTAIYRPVSPLDSFFSPPSPTPPSSSSIPAPAATGPPAPRRPQHEERERERWNRGPNANLPPPTQTAESTMAEVEDWDAYLESSVGCRRVGPEQPSPDDATANKSSTKWTRMPDGAWVQKAPVVTEEQNGGEEQERKPVRTVWRVQSNMVAHSEPLWHEVHWRLGQEATQRDRKVDGGEDGVGFVEMLRPGDRVGLFSEAQYPGWSNHVKEASVEILYSI